MSIKSKVNDNLIEGDSLLKECSVDSGSGEELVDLSIDKLLPSQSPRSAGENQDHVRALAETDTPLPPILVHRATMRVIDGMHRLCAAKLRGDEIVTARVLDCTEREAFILAVKCNVAHGLPLTLSDRKAAAHRLLIYEPQWSDRAIGTITGLSHKTVGTIRRHASGEIPQPGARLGRDGRVRTVRSANRTQLTDSIAQQQSELTDSIDRQQSDAVSTATQRPAAATNTACDTHRQIYQNDAATDQSARHKETLRMQASHCIKPGSEKNGEIQRHQARLGMLTKDPSLKLSETGRTLLRLLTTRAVYPSDWKDVLDEIPPHCTSVVAELAGLYANTWQEFKEELKYQAEISETEPGSS